MSYTTLKLRELKKLAAERGIKPTGDKRKKEVWVQALFTWDIAEAEPYNPTLEEQRQWLEYCYGSYENVDESIEWLSKVDKGSILTRKELLDELVNIVINYDKYPNNARYMSQYFCIITKLERSLLLAKNYRDTFETNYHEILNKYLEELIENYLEYLAGEEDRKKQEEEAKKYQRQYNYYSYNYSNYSSPTVIYRKTLDDYLKILGLTSDASPDDVKRAYRKLSKQYHPDMSTGNAEAFIELNEAYESAIAILNDLPF